MNIDPVRVLAPAGMLGAGFTAESIDRGIARVAGGRYDRDMHAGQQHVLLSQVALQQPDTSV